MAQQDLGGQRLLIIKAAWSCSNTPQWVRLHCTHISPSLRSSPENTLQWQTTSMPSTIFNPAIPASNGPQTHALHHSHWRATTCPLFRGYVLFFETEISGDHKCSILQYTALESLYLLPFKRNLPDKCATTCSFCNFFPRNPVHTEKWKPNIYSKYTFH